MGIEYGNDEAVNQVESGTENKEPTNEPRDSNGFIVERLSQQPGLAPAELVCLSGSFAYGKHEQAQFARYAPVAISPAPNEYCRPQSLDKVF